MNKSNLLRALVVANVLAVFASVGSEAFFAWTLPPDLAAHAHARVSGFTLASFGHAIQLLLLLVTSLVAFASWTALLTFWRHARGLFVFSLALDLLLALISGPRVETAPSLMFRMLSGVLAGVILGLVYFSDLARRFEGQRASQTSTAPIGFGTGRA